MRRGTPGDDRIGLADLRLDRAAIALAALCVGGGWLNLLLLELGWLTRHRSPSRLVDFNHAQSLAAWGELVLVLLAALLALVVNRATLAPGPRLAWAALTGALLLLALDETLALHQRGHRLVQRPGLPVDLPGPPGLAAVAVLLPLIAVAGLVAVPLLRRLPRPTRRGLALGAALMLAAGLGLSAIGGAIDTGHNRDDLPYSLVNALEETVEYLGALTFVLTILRHMTAHTPVWIGTDRADPSDRPRPDDRTGRGGA